MRETAEETEFGFGCVIDEWKVAETGIARVAHPSAGRGAREALSPKTPKRGRERGKQGLGEVLWTEKEGRY